ncbi:MAG TPA: lipid II flippase MurJ [Ignavibacteriaceae bacterium]|nr:lipid II flippase MurJ [Ignavibacteriaceae bacterium]
MGKVLGFFREIIFANNFGLSFNYDIYLVTSIIPLTVSTILFYLVQNYFIPQYNLQKKRGESFSRYFFTKSIVLFLFISILIAGSLFIIKDKILSIYLGSNSENLQLISNIFTIFLLSIPINVLFSVLSAYLQAEFEFKSTAIAQIFLNLSIIFFVFFFSNQLDIYSIVFGYLAGSLCQLLYLLLIVMRRKDIKLSDFRTKGMLTDGISSSIILIFIIESISQLYLISDRFFYLDVESGGIAALNYSTNLYSLPLAIITVTLSTAIFPSLSQLNATNNLKEITIKIKRFIGINLLIFIPISILFFLWGNSIIRLILERGEFNSAATDLTYSALMYYTLGLIPFAIYGGLNKLLYSFGWIKKLLAISVIAMCIKVILNVVFVAHYKQNGLALATSASYVSLFLMTIIILRKKIQEINYKHIIYPTISYVFSAIISFLCVKIIISITIYSNRLLASWIEMFIFALLYTIILYIIKDEEFLNVFKYILIFQRKILKNKILFTI